MKVSLPSHVPMKWVLSFVLLLAVVQVLEGTTLLLACTAEAFIVLASLAFNVAGGLQYPSGGYIFFCTLLSAISGICGKTVLGEPLNTNLTDAQYTLLVYDAGMCAMLLASLINRRLRRRTPLLQNKLGYARTDQVALGCFVISLLANYAAPESIRGTVAQFNRFSILAILLSVLQRVKETDGAKSFTWVAFFAWLYITGTGVFAFTKEGMFTASAVWFIAAVAAGYRLTWKKALVLASIVVPAIVVLTPFSQVGRNFKQPGYDSTAIAIDLLSHPLQTRELYEQQQEAIYLTADTEYHWFDKPQGLLDRMTIIPIDDALIYVTDHGHPGSLEAVWTYFVNAIPRYLYPSKPYWSWGNVYAHEIGVLQEEDATTGIAFTPFADAYHTGRWLGVTVISCGMFLLLFLVCDSLAGSIASGPWALLYTVAFVHQAAEGSLGALVYIPTTYSLAVVAAQIMAMYVAPVIGAFVTAPKRPYLNKQAALKGIAGLEQGAS